MDSGGQKGCFCELVRFLSYGAVVLLRLLQSIKKNPKTLLLAPCLLSNSFFLEEGEKQKGMSLETLSFQIAKIRCQEK
jgi:hypothetical protein